MHRALHISKELFTKQTKKSIKIQNITTWQYPVNATHGDLLGFDSKQVQIGGQFA